MTQQLDILRPGRSPWHVVRRGVQFTGEVVVAGAWSEELSNPLPRDTSFRVVFLEKPQAPPAAPLPPGVLVCIPAPAASEEAQAQRELHVLREVQTGYQTVTDPKLRGLGRALASEEEQSIAQLLALRARAYARGALVASTPTSTEAPRLFQGSDPAQWASALAVEVLRGTLPEPLVNDPALPRPVTLHDVPALLDALSSPDKSTQEKVEALGPGLRLRPSDLSTSPPLTLIQDRLAQRGGRFPVGVLLDELLKLAGLPRYLGVVYLVAFVARNRPAAELNLAEGHALRTRRGAPFLGDRLGWDVLADIAWPDTPQELEECLESIAFPQPPTWQTALPYALELVPNLAGPSGPPSQADREELVEQALHVLRRETGEVRAGMALLETTLGTSLRGESHDRLRTLGAVVDQPDALAFYGACARSNLTLSGLREALATFHRLKPLARAAQELIAARDYLRAIALGPDVPGLSYTSTVLLVQLDPVSLEADPSAWSAARQAFHQFRDQYSRAYRSHHQAHHAASAQLVHDLEHAAPLVLALEHLNTLAELGQPVNPGLPASYRALREQVLVCSERPEALPLDGYPFCRVCLLALGQTLPQREVTTLLTDLERAWREQNRRLASIATHKVLEGADQRAVDKLVRVLQTADISPLANVLDSAVMEFLRSFIQRQPPQQRPKKE